MILRQFPDLQWLKVQAKTRFKNRYGVNGIRLNEPGWPTVILNTTASGIVRDNIPGPLSLFTNLSGTSTVTADNKRVIVTPETFFISNAGQAYTLEIADKPVETFNIHIGDAFARNTIGSLEATPGQLLEDHSVPLTTGFYNRILPSTPAFKTAIRTLKESEGNPLLRDEQLVSLVDLLVKKQSEVSAMMLNIPLIKNSTRNEILRRLLHATDYLYTYYHTNPDLDVLAQISCLSKFHFLRLFKLAYGKTPHQFIIDLRINRAMELLKGSSDIQIIADQLGFGATSTFSRLFKNKVGIYPAEFRLVVRADGRR